MRREGENVIEGPVSSMAGGKKGRTGVPGAALLPRSRGQSRYPSLGLILISNNLFIYFFPRSLPVPGPRRSQSSEPPGGALADPAALGGARARRRKDAGPARAHGGRRVPPPQVGRAGRESGEAPVGEPAVRGTRKCRGEPELREGAGAPGEPAHWGWGEAIPEPAVPAGAPHDVG